MSAVKDKNGNILYSVSYEFDSNGNLTKMKTNNTLTTQYNYQCN